MNIYVHPMFPMILCGETTFRRLKFSMRKLVYDNGKQFILLPIFM